MCSHRSHSPETFVGWGMPGSVLSGSLERISQRTELTMVSITETEVDPHLGHRRGLTEPVAAFDSLRSLMGLFVGEIAPLCRWCGEPLIKFDQRGFLGLRGCHTFRISIVQRGVITDPRFANFAFEVAQ